MIDLLRGFLTLEAMRYGLALAAASLLPVKREWAYRGICLALALLWASAALDGPASRVHPSAFWSALAALESLLFLVMAASGRLRFPLRNGAWAVGATAAILYCLLAFPLLERFRWSPHYAHSAFGFPFPLVVFTCAVLFFAVDRAADAALLPLLVWALLGGPSFPHAGHAERPALALVLLAGALFLLRPPKLRGGSERLAAPGDEYRLAARHRARFGYGLWTLVLATVLVAFLAAARALPFDPREVPRNLALLSALGIVLWLAFPAWQSLWFRYAGWHAARAAGRGWTTVRRGWRWTLLVLLVALLVADQIKPAAAPDAPAAKVDASAAEPDGWLARVGAFFREPFADLRSWLAGKPWFWLLLGAVLLWLIYQAYQGRKRLVIGAFANLTGETVRDKWVEGLGSRLQNELARISELYQVIDEARPAQQGGVLEVTAGVQDVGAILQETSTISLGSLQISGKFLAGLISRIVSGPQLTGALHKTADGYVLTAQLAGGGLAGSWRVDPDPPPAAGVAFESTGQDLVEQLASRVAAKLVDIGSPRWKAVRCFNQGLRFYRETQRRSQDRDTNLREAERCLVRALNDDQRFIQCHHNLGVVYLKLGELGAAQAAFRLALREDPARFESFYALAEAYAQDGKFLEAAWFCRAAVGIDPADPRPWNLLAYARRRRDGPRPLDSDDRGYREVVDDRRIAVALAWRALCRQALAGGSALDRQRDLAQLCTHNLAVVLAQRGAGREESVRLLEQGFWLTPHDTHLRLQRGKALLWSGRSEEAATALDGVFADGLDVGNRGLLWSSLALTRAQSGPEAARLVHRRFLDLAADASPEELDDLIGYSLRTPPEGKGA